MTFHGPVPNGYGTDAIYATNMTCPAPVPDGLEATGPEPMPMRTDRTAATDVSRLRSSHDCDGGNGTNVIYNTNTNMAFHGPVPDGYGTNAIYATNMTFPVPMPNGLEVTGAEPMPMRTDRTEATTVSRLEPLYKADNYVDATPAEKTAAIHQLVSGNYYSSAKLHALTTLHDGMSGNDKLAEGNPRKKVARLKADFLDHSCTEWCLLSTEAAKASNTAVRSMSDDTFSRAARHLHLRLGLAVRTSTGEKRKKVDESTGEFLTKKAPKRKKPNSSAGAPQSNQDDGRSEPFTLTSEEEKKKMIAEFIEATSNSAMKKTTECSFCGTRLLNSETTRIARTQLDVSLLEHAASVLRDICSQPAIQVFDEATISEGCYAVCPTCKKDITAFKFTRLPLRSYANGLWVGAQPKELEGLTLLEEQCIARARTTRCMFKLEIGPTGQYASRGNVCIFVQDPGPLTSILPPPLSQVFDKISVILVGSIDTPVSASMLEHTPLLVRRQRIVDALIWLKKYNPLYADLDPEAVRRNAAEYPEHGVPLPAESYFRVPASSEGSS
ncbi:hypothetical protein K438DRAFT_1953594 [Mycena galopus ATCC 62051]|nr:hypothetical protein K438DRAFT_1953594 [Mycena galopus ATCC 62051]